MKKMMFFDPPVKCALRFVEGISQGRQYLRDIFVCIFNFRTKLKIPNPPQGWRTSSLREGVHQKSAPGP